MLIILLVVNASSQSPYHDNIIEPACDTATAMFLPWTGFRLSREIASIGIGRETHYTRLSYCYEGFEFAHSKVEIPSATDQWLQWTGVFCLNTSHILIPTVQAIHGCYRIARKSEYVGLQIPLLQSDTFVGGVFACSTYVDSGDDGLECDENDEQMMPIAPLLYDEPYMAWRETASDWAQIIPFLYTPDQPSIFYPWLDKSWAEHIDINEDYSSTELQSVTRNIPLSYKTFNRLLYILLRWTPRSVTGPAFKHLANSIFALENSTSPSMSH